MKSALRIFLGDTYYRFRGQMRKIGLSILFYAYNGFLTNFPSYSIRTFYLRRFLGIKIGKDTAIHMGCFFSGNNIDIGSNTVIARKCYLDGRVADIIIKDNVSIAPEVYILSLSHDKNSPSFDVLPAPVLIDEYCWIGARVLILPGVSLGKGAVAGAGSVVTRTVDPYNIVAGNPAKVIGRRKEGLDYKLRYFPLFNTDI